MRFVALRVLVGLGLLCGMADGRAAMVLKPNGQQAAPLRMKAVDADVTIAHGVAVTRATVTFANEAADRVEADFIATVPPRAVVSSFAYWYGSEKVLARVAEKERAAAIYQHITSRMRDPALVEMIGKDTFRARIFPVMPNADLKVEMTLVQPLPSDGQGAFYEFPFLETGRQAPALNAARIAVTVTPEPDVARVVNNYGLAADAGGKFVLNGTNWRPDKPLRVNLKPAPSPLRAALFSARSGGPDGFFVLCLTPARALSHPRVRIAGVRTYELMPARLPAVRAGEALVLTGRYRGHGAATVTLSDGAWKQAEALDFSGEAVPNNPATKVWAAARLEALGAAKGGRAESVRVSKRFGLPGKYTSWIAIPKEERERYRFEKAQAELTVLAAEFAREMAAGRRNGREARALRARFNVVARGIGNDPKGLLDVYVGARYQTLASSLARMQLNGQGEAAQRDARREFTRLARALRENPVKTLARARVDTADAMAREAAEQMSVNILLGSVDSAAVRGLRERIRRLARVAGHRPKDYITAELDGKIWQIAQRVAEQEHKGAKAEQTEEQRRQLAALERAVGRAPDATLRQARAEYVNAEVWNLAEQIAKDTADGRPDSAAARKARRRLDALNAHAEVRPDETIRENLLNVLTQFATAYAAGTTTGEAGTPSPTVAIQRLRDALGPAGAKRARENLLQIANEYNATLFTEQSNPRPDQARVAEAKAALKRLAAIGAPVRASMKEVEAAQNEDPVFRARAALIRELRRESPTPGRVQALSRRLVRADDAYKGKDYGEAHAERIAVEVELAKLDRAGGTLTEAQQARKAALTKRDEALRVRMGDPLISIEAPMDARRVVARMPDGRLLPLSWNPATRRWEARFDVPSWAAEGAYTVTIVVVRADGSRRVAAMTYHVDLSPPEAAVSSTAAGPVVRLEVRASPDTARVTALLPWGAEVSLSPSPRAPGRFFGLAPVPPGFTGRGVAVRYILMDRAPNRAEVGG
jgi:hypothetical protein